MEQFKVSLRFREKIGYLIIAVLFLVMFVGLFKLQVIQFSEFSERSEDNRIRLEPKIPYRGNVNDRDGNIIIDNRPSYTVSIVPSEEIPGVTLPNLSQLINLDTTQIRTRIKRNMVSRYQPATIKRDVPFEVVAVLEEQSRNYPGVLYQMDMVRQFNRELGAETITGYVGEVSEDELVQYADYKYHLGSIIGKKGLEKKYDLLLRGKEGTAFIEVTASGQRLGEYSGKSPIQSIPGANLTLTIDNDLQMACTNALDTFCCGAIVAIDPRNGEILAMTSYPGFDANIFSSVIPEALWQEISNNPSFPLLNRPLTGLYPPGSTVKFITIGAGLEEGIINANTTFKPCLGGMQFGNRFFRCWLEGGHGSLNAERSLEQSCDVFLYQLGLKLGVDKLSEYYDGSGFGKLTNIDLPNEAPGLNPNSEYYNNRYGIKKWTRTLVLNLAIGQGELLVTPLQLAQFFSGLALNGIVYRPHLVKNIAYPNNQVEDTKPEIAITLPFSQRTMSILREGMRLVVEGERGTAKHLRNKYYSIGGKTGTAENPHGENHSWFVGVAPLESPEIIVAAIVENAGHGSDVAAPLVGQIIRTYMAKAKGIPLVEPVIKTVVDSNEAIVKVEE
jgi:penicillin-binding protein 2